MNFRQQLSEAYQAGYESALYEQHGLPDRGYGAPDLLTPLLNFFKDLELSKSLSRYRPRAPQSTIDRTPRVTDLVPELEDATPMPNIYDMTPEGIERAAAIKREEAAVRAWYKQSMEHKQNPTQVEDPGSLQDLLDRFFKNDPYYNGTYFDDYGQYIGPGSDMGPV